MTVLKRITKDMEQPTLRDMQEFVDGRIEIVYLSNGDHLIINEEGLLDGLEPNMEATDIWWSDVGLDNVLSHGMPPLVGDILLIEGGLD
tara:strand:+ start:259 stop:525 length:267 start_codon:yes stop_codon:yes gene_type:complete